MFPFSRAATYRLLTLGRPTGGLCPYLESFNSWEAPEDVDAMTEFLLSRLRRPHSFHANVSTYALSDEAHNQIRDHPELRNWVGHSDRHTHWKNQRGLCSDCDDDG